LLASAPELSRLAPRRLAMGSDKPESLRYSGRHFDHTGARVKHFSNRTNS
jgi:hypothetical protein